MQGNRWKRAGKRLRRIARNGAIALAVAAFLVGAIFAVQGVSGSFHPLLATPALAQEPDQLDKAGLEALLNKIKLPPGFHITLFASGLVHPRQMCISPSGTVFVGTMEGKDGIIYALPDKNRDGIADEAIVIAKSLWLPNGVALKDGNLYIAEINRITRLDDIEHHLKEPPKLVVVANDFSKKTHHGWKYIRFGPDGRLYVPQGAPCNVCEPEPLFGCLSSMKEDGTDRQVLAKGIRNTVGFDWDPLTKKLWFTDNGRDLMGDNKPPDELNFMAEKGMHFGFPYMWGDNQPDPEFGKKAPAGLVMTPPAMCLGPHVASLGMRFYDGKNFPAEYKHRIFIAEHGSWNRSKKIGYRVTMVTLEGDKAVKYEPFATGWLNDATQEVSGRPVDIGITKDGALLVSDDYAGNIYRISYRGK